ncbi:ABC transporter permease [Cytobacillus kochii]|uniref:ABC transporter permease n=1 Tax=Cytobacillus kochii TaxID=859143 RepID=UPI002E1F87E3|nr:ABC transporter permease [Cytobacillus kochii]
MGTLLNGNQEYDFVITDESEAHKELEEGNSEVVIRLFENDYQIISASNTHAIQLVEDYLVDTPFQMQTESIDGGEVPEYNMSLQLLFGFTLFLVMFTIGFKVNGVTSDKVSGVWDRMILSPVSKTAMYTGHLFYSFLIGFIQIFMVLLIFNYVMDYDLGHNFGMILTVAAVFTLSMVSLSMLFTGFIKTPEQFNMVFPSVIPILPVISGVYMPPGMLSHPVLLFIADLFPLVHAMEALMDIALFDAGWNDIIRPIVLMLLIAVICMGVGVNLVERRTK